MSNRSLRAAVLACAFLAGASAFAMANATTFAGTTLPGLAPPHYPEAAIKAGIEGHVRVAVTIDADGNLTAATIVDVTPPGWGFEDAALAAVRAGKYQPPGREIKRTVTINFIP